MTDTATPTRQWERLDALARRHGASYYLADLDGFESNCRRFLAAFRAHYPKTSIGYSYKTNYLPPFILRAHGLGAYSEVVSRFEFEIARGLGVPGHRIIFNGPVKRAEDLEAALGAGALVNADSLPEIEVATRVSERLDAPVPVGVRCYLGAQTPGSRFGIDITAPDGSRALAAIDETANLRLAGLHCHHSGDRSAAQYRARTQTMIRLHREALGGRPLDFIDIGGGFASRMHPDLARQLESASESFETYAEAVAGAFRAAYGDDGPELILEPGMALLADAMTFVTRVESVKTQHRPIAVVDGSGFHVQPPWNLLRRGINLPIRVIGAPGQDAGHEGPWDVVGHTCIEGDVLHEGHRGPVGIGDYVVFDNVGAYTNVLAAPFIHGTPPIIAASGDGEGDVLRPASSARDLLRSYGVPAGTP